MKHLIEINPVTFPNGEPTAKDIGKINLSPSGKCTIDDKKFVDPRLLYESDKNNWNLLDEQIIRRRLKQRWLRGDEIQEDSPWSLQHRSDF